MSESNFVSGGADSYLRGLAAERDEAIAEITRRCAEELALLSAPGPRRELEKQRDVEIREVKRRYERKANDCGYSLF